MVEKEGDSLFFYGLARTPAHWFFVRGRKIFWLPYAVKI